MENQKVELFSAMVFIQKRLLQIVQGLIYSPKDEWSMASSFTRVIPELKALTLSN